jgi:hypothetical protein
MSSHVHIYNRFTRKGAVVPAELEAIEFHRLFGAENANLDDVRINRFCPLHCHLHTQGCQYKDRRYCGCRAAKNEGEN